MFRSKSRFCFPGRQPKTENKDRKKQKTVNTTSQDGMDDTVVSKYRIKRNLCASIL